MNYIRAILFTQEQKEFIKEKYLDNWTIKKIGEVFNVTRSPIRRVLLEYNIPIRKITSRYYADYNIFEDINTAEKAYWLGFLAADGCNYQRKQNATISLRLSQKDINHLEKFKKFL